MTSKKGNPALAGLVIGLSLTLVHILGIALTGTSVNPARSLMPAIFAGGVALNQVWIFIVAPLIGGALAAIVYSFLEKEKNSRQMIVRVFRYIACENKGKREEKSCVCS